MSRANALISLNEHGLYEYVKRKKGKKYPEILIAKKLYANTSVKYLLPIHKKIKITLN